MVPWLMVAFILIYNSYKVQFLCSDKTIIGPQKHN